MMFVTIRKDQLSTFVWTRQVTDCSLSGLTADCFISWVSKKRSSAVRLMQTVIVVNLRHCACTEMQSSCSKDEGLSAKPEASGGGADVVATSNSWHCRPSRKHWDRGYVFGQNCIIQSDL